jgi:hypothetical protein
MAARARREGTELVRIGREFPYQVHDILESLRDGQIEVGFVHKGLDEMTAKLDVVFNRLTVALVVLGGLIGSSLIGIFAESGPHVLGLHLFSVIGFAVSGLLGAWLLIAILRAGRL